MPRVKSAFSIHWDPDPIVWGQALLEVDAALMRTGIPLAAIAGEVREDIKERFATRTSPDGVPWKEWSESYAPKAEAYANQRGMLRRDDFLYEAVTNEDAIIVTNNELFFNENQMESIPPSSGRKTGQKRGYYHQEGVEGKLPARPFLGLTTETRVFVDAAFTEWFNESLALFTRKGGRVGTRHSLRGGGGRFIPRSSPMPSFMRRRR